MNPKQGIIVQPTKAGIIESVLVDSNVVQKKHQKHVEEIDQRLSEMLQMLEAPDEDPTMKSCSKCLKEGRIHLHPIEHFSLLESGRRHSQCKRCRTEQANKWCHKRRKHRREYHRQYRAKMKEMPPKPEVPPEDKPKKLRRNLQELYIASKG